MSGPGKGWRRATTHCPQGHAYTPENIKWNDDWRSCRTCDRDASRERMRRYRAEARA